MQEDLDCMDRRSYYLKNTYIIYLQTCNLRYTATVMFTGTGTSTRPGIDTTGTGTGYGTGTWYQVRTGICSATTTVVLVLGFFVPRTVSRGNL